MLQKEGWGLYNDNIGRIDNRERNKIIRRISENCKIVMISEMTKRNMTLSQLSEGLGYSVNDLKRFFRYKQQATLDLAELFEFATFFDVSMDRMLNPTEEDRILCMLSTCLE